MTKLNYKRLPELLALRKEEIKMAFVAGGNSTLLIVLQQTIARSNEEEIILFFAFMESLGYASLTQKDNALVKVRSDAYTALLDTAKSRATLLKYLREYQHEHIFSLVQSLAI